jgi:PAS domain S-box-containing protein
MGRWADEPKNEMSTSAPKSTVSQAASVPLSRAEARELTRLQTAELFRLFPASIALSFVGSIATFAMLIVTGDAARGATWFAFATAVMLFRSLVWWQYSNDRDEHTARWWSRLVIFSNVLAGIQWGLLATWLFVPEPYYRGLFTAIVIVGYVAGGAITFAPVRFAHAALAIPATVPVAINVFLLQNEVSVVAALLCLFMLAAVLYLAEEQHQIVRRRLLLEMESAERLRAATDENSSLGQSMRNLEHRAEVVKRAQLEARRRAETLETHVRTTLLPVIECDHSSRVIEWNDAAREAFGYHYEELHALSLNDLIAVTSAGALQQDWRAFLASTLNQNRAAVVDAFVARKDGSRAPARLYVTPISVDGKAMRAAIIATDPHGELASKRAGRRTNGNPA